MVEATRAHTLSLLLASSIAACGEVGEAGFAARPVDDAAVRADRGEARSTDDAAAHPGRGETGADAAALPTMDEARDRFNASLVRLDQRCDRDADCTVVVADVSCAGCDVLATSRHGSEQVRAAVAEFERVCGADEPSADPSPHCTESGFSAICNQGRCERTMDVCSPGCSLDSDGRCSGPAGVSCERCPPAEPAGPCKIRGQRCQYGECTGVGVCDIDQAGLYGNPGAQVWMFTWYDCFL